MQAARFVQAVILMLLLAMAASCASSKQYIATVFPSRNAPVKTTPVKDSSQLRFLAFDTTSEKAAWVNDWIGKDSTGAGNETAGSSKEPAVLPATDQPVVAKNAGPGTVRSKKKRD
jgi:hypothetical protein